ncbi:hypothetical protein KZ813_08350 [Sphingomonas sp. RHCKR7]|nr:hypothetical protein [Sphingomonas folli]
MPRVWLVVNAASGSAQAALGATLAALDRHAILVGRTDFPASSLPQPAALDAADADTLAVLAGDGTINAAARAYAEWDGALLILPGGTMNLLARALHGEADPATIVAAAPRASRVALSMVAAGEHRALVGLILGPAASWNAARERLRQGRWRTLARAISHAWQRSWRDRVRLDGVPGAAQAVFVRAEAERLVVVAVEASGWGALAGLGRAWLGGDWSAASAATRVERTRLRVRGRRPVTALVDGEPVQLPAAAELRVARSRPIFLTTKAEA